MPRKASDITVTDQFCGAGGSSIGAEAAGVRLRMALNHWELAIETHNTNFPHADHDCTDVSACDPRRYPSTNILITSPECTNHSLAKGARRKGLAQRDMFQPAPDDPAAERSRATMWDVPRFAEFHRYDVIIVENVVDARHWDPFPAWLHAMHRLGYDHQIVYLNSMFCWPTPQSRDRMYVVFSRKGNPKPDLEIRPPAWCASCERDVEGVQSWKPGRSWGRYQRQYVYCCPRCAGEVQPYYYAALNAIDWTVPAERIGDRRRPLKPRTLDRIRYGLDRYGRQPLVVRTNMTSGVGCRVRAAAGEPLDTQPGSNITALVHPAWLIHTRHTSGLEHRVRDAGAEPIPTQTADLDFGVAYPPAFLSVLRGTADDQRGAWARGADEALSGITAGGVHHALVMNPAWLLNNMENNRARGADEPLHTVCTGGNLGVVINGAALLNLRDWNGAPLVRELHDALPTQVANGPQDALIARRPFLVSYYGQDQAADVADAMGTLSTRDRHALIGGGEDIDVDDCYFRMLQPHEIGAGMAFPADYQVLGNKRDRVKQYGNAVTPPAMRILMERAVASLEAA